MPRFLPYQASFAAGVVSPTYHGRIDHRRYQAGLARCDNAIVLGQGPVRRRPGTRWVNYSVQSETLSRLLPFERARNLGYIVEITANNLRVWAAGTATGGSPVFSTPTLYTITDVMNMQYAQSADVMILVSGSGPPTQLLHFGPTTWVFQSMANLIQPPPTDEIGEWPNLTLTVPTTTAPGNSVTVTASGSTFLAADVGRDLDLIGRGQGEITAYTGDGLTATVRAATQMLAGSYAPNTWRLAGSPQTLLTPSATGPVGNIITLTAQSTAFRPTDLGKYIGINGGLVEITSVNADLLHVDGRVLVELTSTTAASGGAWTIESSDWSDARGWPTGVTWFQDRLYFTRRNRIWGSQAGDYYNFAGGAADDAAVTFTLADNQVNDIQWVTAHKSLLCGTLGNEYVIHGTADGPITPTSITAQPHTTYGSAKVMPARISNTVLFVTRGGRHLRELVYSYEIDGYVAPNLLLLADHLVPPPSRVLPAGSEIKELSYQREPDSILWAVTSAGELIAMTYLRDQEVFAWHRHPTAGTVESVQVIPHPSGLKDEVWITTQRAVSGTPATIRSLERLDDDGLYYDELQTDQTITFTNTPAGTVVGFDALKGQLVAILADGAVVKSQTVTAAGEITMPYPAAKLEVGRPFDTVIETLAPALALPTGPIRPGRQRVARVWLDLLDTLGVEVAGDQVPFRVGRDRMDQAVPALFSGQLSVPVRASWTEGAGVVTVAQRQPLPFMLRALALVLDVGDTGGRSVTDGVRAGGA
jgi:hypothetical protein